LYAEQKDQHQLRINIVDINGSGVSNKKINSGGQIDISNFKRSLRRTSPRFETKRKTLIKL
jgi:hypothetical protein